MPYPGYSRSKAHLFGVALLASVAVDGRAAVRVVADRPEQILEPGREAWVQLSVRVLDAAGKADPAAQVLLRATAGSIEGLEQTGRGEFRARLRRPVEGFPQLALVTAANVAPVAIGKAPEIGTAVIAFSARLDLAGTAEAGAKVRLRVGGKDFGPVVADAKGAFMVPIVVPPGEGYADSVAVDALGNTSRERLNLFLPAVQRLHAFVYPDAMVADGRDRGWVFVATVDTAGRLESKPIAVRNARGSCGLPEALAPGLSRLVYLAPASLDDGTDRLEIAIDKTHSLTAVPITLLAGPPTAVRFVSDPRRPVADGSTAVRLRAEVRDEKGNLATGHRLNVSGAKMEIRDGSVLAHVPPRGQAGEVRLAYALEPNAADCPRATLRQVDGGIRVVDVRGIGCTGELRRLDDAGLALERHTVLATEPTAVQLGAGRWEFETSGRRQPVMIWQSETLFGVAPPPLVPVLHGEVTIAYAVPNPFALRWRLVQRQGDRLTLRLEGPDDVDLAGRVQVEVSRGKLTLGVAAPGSLEVVLTGSADAALRGTDVLATDPQTGVTAWWRVP